MPDDPQPIRVVAHETTVSVHCPGCGLVLGSSSFAAFRGSWLALRLLAHRRGIAPWRVVCDHQAQRLAE